MLWPGSGPGRFAGRAAGRLMRLALGAGLLCAPGAALAQSAPEFDGALTYYARENVASVDNDIFRGTLGVHWRRPGGGTRAELTFGVRNEFFEGGYPGDAKLALLRHVDRDWGRINLGGTLGRVAGRETSAELGLGAEIFAGDVTARGLIGLQGITGDGPFDGGRQVSGFVVGEVSYYPFNALALRLAASLDDADPMTSVGIEAGVPGTGFALFADWHLAPTKYRNDKYYNDLVFGGRYTIRFDSLRARDRRTPLRALMRPIDIQ